MWEGLPPTTMVGMSIPLLIPLEGGFGHHGPPVAGGALPHVAPFAPFLGGLMFLLLLLIIGGTLFFLARKGKIGPPPWVTAARSPEAEAKRILAERFARGDITTDDFMERASILNWTPGAEPLVHRRPRKHRR
jgi:putative membrane protein